MILNQIIRSENGAMLIKNLVKKFSFKNDKIKVILFNSRLKQEIFHEEIYRSFWELKSAIDQYIYYSNNERVKNKFNWQSPVQFRKSAQVVA